MPAPSAYLLVAHGSRDPRSHLALTQLARHFTQELIHRQGNSNARVPLVKTGTLEFGTMSLEAQILDLGRSLQDQGGNQITVIPLFLLPGNHVMVDIPAAVAAAQVQLGEQVQVQVRSHLGTHPHMATVLKHRMTAMDHPWILMAHGTTHPGGNQPVEALADQLGAVPAYWSGNPDLETRARELAATHPEHIGVLPYFLFTGRITDAILRQVNQLQLSLDPLRFVYIPPLEANHEVARLLLDLI